MKILNNTKDLLSILESDRESGNKISIVPTMGNLHPGHLSLVDACKKNKSKILVTIFVNPLQFNDTNDFKNYPKSLDKDLKTLEGENVDYVFLPNTHEILSEIPNMVTLPWGFSNLLCGKHRKNHFDGVFKILKVFFDLIKPDFAFFGEKDYQQCLLVKYMLQESYISDNTLITICPTIRDQDKLPLSSRNLNLNDVDRNEAAKIFFGLARTIIHYFKETGLKDFDKLLPESSKLRFDYVNIYNDNFLYDKHGLISQHISENTANRIFIAFTMSNVRLIDNYLIEGYDTL